MTDVYLTPEDARAYIVSLQAQLTACMKVLDEAIALVKARTADVAHLTQELLALRQECARRDHAPRDAYDYDRMMHP